MSSIREFFKRKKIEAKFKTVGPGRKLNTEETPKTSKNVAPAAPAKRTERQDEQNKQRLEAILARQQNSQDIDWSRSAIKSQALKEIAQEKEEQVMSLGAGPSKNDPYRIGPPMLAVSGVFFKCPEVSNEIGTYSQMQIKIKNYLEENYQKEPELTSVVMIHSCNRNSEAKKAAIDTLSRYLINIINNPSEPKYRKIRLNNKVFQEKVAPTEGSTLFLEALGFVKETIAQDEKQEAFYVFPEAGDTENLSLYLDALNSAEPMKPELDRGLQVLMPAVAAKHMDLPDDFFSLSVNELKKEHQNLKEQVELMTQMRTSQQRQKDSIKDQARKYIYTLIRIKFPNDVILQGTFSVHETIKDVINFITENLNIPDQEFNLTAPGGEKLVQENTSLLVLQLVPAAIINIHFPKNSPSPFLKEDVLNLLQSLDNV